MALADRPRRPRDSPGKTPPAIEHAVLAVRDQRNWGPRKIHAFLLQDACRQGHVPPDLPSVRTVASILARNGRLVPPAPRPPEPQRFERAVPNALWQVDFKGPVEVARHKWMPFSALDDAAGEASAPLALSARVRALPGRHHGQRVRRPVDRVRLRRLARAGSVRQRVFDHGHGSSRRPLLVRRPADPTGHPTQPRPAVPPRGKAKPPDQTQGKVERMHGSSVRELIDFDARRDSEEHFRLDCHRWRNDYNTVRPHEALGDQPPASRWTPSPRRRPDTLPEAADFYPPDDARSRRTVDANGTISVGGCRILCGRGIAGQPVRIEQRDSELAVFYCWKEFRTLSHDQLVKGKVL